VNLGRTLSVGSVTAAITIAACVSLSPHLSSTEQDSIVVSPASLDFGSVQVGDTASRGIQISPAAGIQDDIVMAITSCPQFPITTTGLPAHVFRSCISGSGSGSGSGCTFDVQTYSFTASFAPTVQGVASCKLTITLATGTQSMTLTGTGTAPDHLADVEPSKIDFGETRKGQQSSAETITVRNAGAKDLDVASVTIDDPTFVITQGNPAAHVVALGTSENYSVVCAPTDTATHTGTVTITSDDAASPALVTLQCIGIDSNIGIDPSPANLSTRVGAAVGATMTISNSGSADSTLDSVTLSADSSPELTIASVSGTALPANTGTATVTLNYTALTPHPAGTLGTLIVMHDGDPTPRTAPITADARLVTVASQPAAVDFGPVCTNQKVDQLVAVFAQTDGEFVIDTFVQPASPFTVSYTGPPQPLAMPERANDIPFTISVMATAPGDVASTVVVQTDAPGPAAMYSVPVKAHVLPAGVTATPATEDFGVVNVDTTSSGQMITLTNCNIGTVNVTAAHIDGADADSFALVSPSSVATALPTAASEQFIVVLSPHIAGTKQAQLVIEYDNGTAMIELDGDVTGGSDDTTKPRETYYSCNSGVPATLVPALAVLVLLVVRRRRKQ
jgi:hypothetical protein